MTTHSVNSKTQTQWAYCATSTKHMPFQRWKILAVDEWQFCTKRILWRRVVPGLNCFHIRGTELLPNSLWFNDNLIFSDSYWCFLVRQGYSCWRIHIFHRMDYRSCFVTILGLVTPEDRSKPAVFACGSSNWSRRIYILWPFPGTWQDFNGHRLVYHLPDYYDHDYLHVFAGRHRSHVETGRVSKG